MVPVFKSSGERSTAKKHRPFSLLSVVCKIVENFINNRLIDNLNKYSMVFFLISSMVAGLLVQLQI